jgi:hypothetical protein
MIRVDGFYLYTTGHSIHPLESISGDAPFGDWALRLMVADGALVQLLDQSIFHLQTSRTAGEKLLTAIKSLTKDFNRTEAINRYEAYLVTSALGEFEHVLSAEFGMMNLYFVIKKRGYDTMDLIHRGHVLYPPDLAIKVPEAIPDVDIAAKCIAFELPTPAGFHLHRANESVLRRYYDAVTNGAERPKGRNMGDYLVALREKNAGSAEVLSALKDLKDLHRNPLIHPEHSLESVDEAIGLMGSIQAVTVHMLRAIPDSQQLTLAATGQS